MLFAPPNVHVQAMALETSQTSSQVALPVVDPAWSTDYQLLDDKIRVIKGFLAFWY